MPTRSDLPFRPWIPYFVLTVSLLITATSTYYASATARTRDRLRFNNAVQDTQYVIQKRLDTYIALLRAGSAFFAASQEVTRDEFQQFVERLDLPGRYPGILGIGYSARVQPQERAAVEARMVQEGVPDFTIWPRAERPEYHAILFLEPLDRRNRAAIGYDMFVEPVPRAAMERARDTGLPAASGKVTLAQEVDEWKRAGFLIYVAVYDHRRPAPATVVERRDALRGFVYSPFRTDDLVGGILSNAREPLVSLQVFDAGGDDRAHLLYNSAPGFNGTSRERFTALRGIDVAGRRWHVIFSNGAGFDAEASTSRVLFIFAGGLLISLMLFGVTQSEARALAEAEHIAADLQRSREAQEMLLVRERMARAEAQEANRAKDEFLATLSHELRTPLNAILGWASMLRTGHVPEGRRERALEIIERSANAQTRLIEDLLDVSRIITGKLRLELSPIDLRPILQAAVDSVRPAANARRIQLSLSIDAPTAPIAGDAERLQQIVWNLLSNAIKFTAEGGRVTLELDNADHQHVEVRVSDTGMGISPEFLPHIFERFRQADSSTTRAHTGIGLGLAIVRHLVELHGGTIRVESEGESKGARFIVQFPARAASGEAVTGVSGPYMVR